MFNMQNKLINRKSEMEFTFHCCDCGKDVGITLGEVLFYDDKSLVVPKRCADCKDVKNKRIAEESVEHNA